MQVNASIFARPPPATSSGKVWTAMAASALAKEGRAGGCHHHRLGECGCCGRADAASPCRPGRAPIRPLGRKSRIVQGHRQRIRHSTLSALRGAERPTAVGLCSVLTVFFVDPIKRKLQ